MHFQMIQIAKKSFVAIFSTMVRWIHLILRIVMVLNVLQHQAMFPSHEGSFKSHHKNEILALLLSFVYLIEFLQSSNKVHLFKHIRTIKKCSNHSTSYEVEDKCDSTLQFSTSVELQQSKNSLCVCVSVSKQKL